MVSLFTAGNLEPRFVATLLPPIVSTLLHYPSYSTCLPSDGKVCMLHGAQQPSKYLSSNVWIMPSFLL